MAEQRRNGNTPKSTTPERFPESVPPEAASSYNFSLQTIVDLHRNFGKIENAVGNLEKAVEAQGKTLKGIERTIAIATGAFIIISAIIGFAIKYGLDMLAKVVEKSI